jgi:hypothetical protein
MMRSAKIQAIATRKPRLVAAMDVLSRVLTAAPVVCLVALLSAFACVRFVLGSWPLVYGDDAGDWFVMVAGVVASWAYTVSRVGLVLWAPATGVTAKLSDRPLFLRRLLLFGGGWAMLLALHTFYRASELIRLLD